MRPPLRVVNVGGSLTTALLLSAVAWGVRLLRAKNILRPAERPPKPAARASSKALYGRLSPLAFRLLVRALLRSSARDRHCGVCDARAAYGARAQPLNAVRGSQLDIEPVPFVLVDVRTAEEAGDRPLSSLLGTSYGGRAAAVQLPGAIPCAGDAPRAHGPRH